jgi:hypothetical protein
MHLKTEKNSKTLSSGQKIQKTQKNPLGCFFYKKTRIFSNPVKNEKENRTWFKQIYFQGVTVDTVHKYIVVHLRGWKTQSRLLRKIQKFLICPSLCYSSFLTKTWKITCRRKITVLRVKYGTYV